MDGVHDLGGKQGFGPIETDEPERAFHAPWEGRAWAIGQCVGAPDWTIDWWRHVRELVDPADYLRRPYFDSWAQTDLAALVNSGVVTLEEAVSGRAVAPAQPPPAIDVGKALEQDRASATRFDRAIDQPPAFHAGDRLRALDMIGAAHTRLPQYVRGRIGVVHAHHGAHVLPDLNARGEERAEHLYSILFEAPDLWPEAAGRRDRIYLDLWESYLERI